MTIYHVMELRRPIWPLVILLFVDLPINLTNLHQRPFTSYNIHGKMFRKEIFIHDICENIVPLIF